MRHTGTVMTDGEGMSTIESESVELAGGTKLPILGFGTWQLRGGSAVDAVMRALDVGYRHIDTATAYGNEEQVGQAVAHGDVRREDIFVTTKLPPSRAGRERETLEASLDALAFDYVDLWLVHWPPTDGARPDVWERLLELQVEGLTREVGVSNYSASQIDELRRATGHLPAVNQIEWSPPLFDPNVLEEHRRRAVQLEGYSPLLNINLRDPRLGESPAVTVLHRHRSCCVGTSSTRSSRFQGHRMRNGLPRTQTFSALR